MFHSMKRNFIFMYNGKKVKLKFKKMFKMK